MTLYVLQHAVELYLAAIQAFDVTPAGQTVQSIQ
jgi:hypothetical protein